MNLKEKALVLFNKFYPKSTSYSIDRKNQKENAKECALIAIKLEYNSLREQLFNLRSCGIIKSEKVYLKRTQDLIDEEKEVKQEIEML